jgi:hypothetical protein
MSEATVTERFGMVTRSQAFRRPAKMKPADLERGVTPGARIVDP